MALHIRCECGRALKAAEENVGKKGKCPGCGRVFVIAAAPAASGAPPGSRGQPSQRAAATPHEPPPPPEPPPEPEPPPAPEQPAPAVTTWAELLEHLRRIGKDGAAAPDRSFFDSAIFSQFPYQIQFALVRGKLDDPAYFRDVPFCPITPDMVERADQYIRHPRIPPLVALMSSSLSPDRYSLASGGRIARDCSLGVDVAICQVASCISHHGTINALDVEKVGRCAFEAVQHYADIPIAAYFFGLPFFRKVLETKRILLNEAPIPVYMGVEALLLELYDEISEGQVITDELVRDRVRGFFP